MMRTTVSHSIPEGEYPLSGEAVRSFQRDGHVLLRQVLDAKSAALFAGTVRNAVHAHNKEKRKIEERDTYGKAFLQTTNIWEVDRDVKAFTMAKRFARIAAQLLGVEKVRLYHDQALFKEPGGGHTPWHQDQFYWPLDTDKTITMWMPLVDVDKDMGMLTFASGSHLQGLHANVEISDQSEAALNDYVKQQGFGISRSDFMQAGDATWHNGWIMHSAPGNYSQKVREVMTVIYYADGAKITRPINPFQEEDRKRWFCGLPPGSLAASEINPIP